MYADGRGVQKDDAKAAQWFQKAAGQGDAYSQRMLGLMHLQGRGVVRDRQTGCDLLRASAQQGAGESSALYTQFCVANTAVAPATKANASKRDPEKLPVQAAPSKTADSSQAELEKRLKDEIARLVESAETLGSMR
jgi:TPR repeat protein